MSKESKAYKNLPKKVYIRTFGCQMNVRDSEYVAGLLIDQGFSLVNSPERADLVLFNSCSVRKHAEDRLFSNIADLKDLKRRKPGLIIGLMGCTAQNYREKAFRRAPLVDFVCGPGNESDIPDIVRGIHKDGCNVVAADKVNRTLKNSPPEYRERSFKAFVAIGEGCDNFCSYCVVPYVRGRERSRPAGDIIKEVKSLADRGFKEIMLLGQNVNSYSSSGANGFVDLLEKIDKVKGIDRVRFMTSHPKDATIDLFRSMRDLKCMCEHLHLPLQAGSNRILRAMNRKYTVEKYLKLVDQYRKLVPGGSLTTDLIVGFPSETEADFKKTYSILKDTSFDSSFIFKYSPRPPAKAALLKDDVTEEAKSERIKALLDLQCRMSESINRKMLGRTLEILADSIGEKDAASITGRTRTNKVAIFKGAKGLIGKTVNVKIDKVSPHALKGRIVR